MFVTMVLLFLDSGLWIHQLSDGESLLVDSVVQSGLHHPWLQHQQHAKVWVFYLFWMLDLPICVCFGLKQVKNPVFPPVPVEHSCFFYKLVFQEIIHQMNQNHLVDSNDQIGCVLCACCSWTNLRSAEKRGRHHLGQHLLRLPAAAETSLHELLFPPRGGRYQSIADSGIQVEKKGRRENRRKKPSCSHILSSF